MKDAASLFKILSVDRRIEIIGCLKSGSMNVNSLANFLKSAGLVRDERKGYWVYYFLNRDSLEKARQRLNRICTCGCLPKSCHKK